MRCEVVYVWEDHQAIFSFSWDLTLIEECGSSPINVAELTKDHELILFLLETSCWTEAELLAAHF